MFCISIYNPVSEMTKGVRSANNFQRLLLPTECEYLAP